MDKFTVTLRLLTLLIAMSAGCSQRTVDKSQDAAEAAGDAIGSAVNDAAEATRDAADSVDRATEDELDDDTAE